MYFINKFDTLLQYLVKKVKRYLYKLILQSERTETSVKAICGATTLHCRDTENRVNPPPPFTPHPSQQQTPQKNLLVRRASRGMGGGWRGEEGGGRGKREGDQMQSRNPVSSP
jgi:hypothetical protein